MRREALTERRRALAMSQEDLASHCDVDPATVSRWERGITTPRGAERRRLAKALGWSLTELDAALGGGSSAQVHQQLSSGWLGLLTTVEQSASALRTWQTVAVPGLLQTPEYAAALVGHDDLVAARIQRQSALTRNDPMDLTAILDQSVLLRPIGGRDVLLGQLHHLAKMSYRPNVDLHIMPFEATSQPLVFGAIMIFDIGDDQIVYLEHKAGGQYLDRRDDVETHVEAFDELVGLALSQDESINLISRTAKEIT